MEKEKSQSGLIGVLLLLFGVAVYLLFKYTFAVVVFSVAAGALAGALMVKDPAWSLLLKLVAGFFGILFVLHLVKLSDDATERAKPQIQYKPKTQEEKDREMLCAAANGPSRAVMNCPQ